MNTLPKHSQASLPISRYLLHSNMSMLSCLGGRYICEENMDEPCRTCFFSHHWINWDRSRSFSSRGTLYRDETGTNIDKVETADHMNNEEEEWECCETIGNKKPGANFFMHSSCIFLAEYASTSSGLHYWQHRVVGGNLSDPKLSRLSRKVMILILCL